MSEHYWYGYSFAHDGQQQWIDDTITVHLSGRKPPNFSYHIFLLEAFLAEGRTLELDLVTETNGKERFVCMYNGRNIHYFTLPVIPGHIYHRHIRFGDNITYMIQDTTSRQMEFYDLPIGGGTLNKVFHGVEWHMTALPFPLKYNAVIQYMDKGQAQLETDRNKKPYPIEIKTRELGMSITNKKEVPPIVPIALLVILAAVLDRTIVRGFLL